MRTTLRFAVLFLLATSAAAAGDGNGDIKNSAAAAASPNWDIAFGGYTASDYILRGISLSAHHPSGYIYSEWRYNPVKDVQFYAATSTESIDFSNQAAAEVDFYSGIRPTFDKLALDFGFWYYWFPGGRLFTGPGPLGGPTGVFTPNANCTNRFTTPTGGCNISQADPSYWEVYGRATYTVNGAVTVGATAWYSPSWLNAGAESLWAAGSLKLTAPSAWIPTVLPKGTGVFLLGEMGHYWLGQTNAFYGNTQLPDYNGWDLGLTFNYKVFSLDFRYYDTDLSKADCNVVTGDRAATYSPSNITSINVSGLGSNRCGAAFAVKAAFDLTVQTNLK